MINLSIITINYNNASGLKKTVDSVINQNYKDFDYIIIDGKSTDNSVEVIKSINLPNFNWVSEKDIGIYNAMNKGIKMAEGDYLLFLNSGDFLKNNKVLDEVLFSIKKGVSFIGCNLILNYKNEKKIKKHPEKISFSYLLTSTILHPSTFIKKEMFDKYGSYNEKNKIVSDWEFFFKAIALNGESFQKIDKELTIFDMYGISSNSENSDIVKYEKEQVFNKYLKSIYVNDLDKFLFNQLKNPTKRIKYLMKIEKNIFLRKITTFCLSILNKFS